MSYCHHDTCAVFRMERAPEDTLADMGRFLGANLEWLRHHPAAAECADEISHVTGQARRIIDSAPSRVYIGPCDPAGAYGDEPCPVDIYARQGRTEAPCPACGLVWNVANRREFLLEAVEDHLATAAELSRFLTAYGEPLTAKRVQQWKDRGLIAPHAEDSAGRAMFLIGEVVALLATMSKGRAA